MVKFALVSRAQSERGAVHQFGSKPVANPLQERGKIMDRANRIDEIPLLFVHLASSLDSFSFFLESEKESCDHAN